LKKNILIFLAVAVAAWVFFYHPKADWQGRPAPDDPFQASDNLPAPWSYKDFTITPRAKYHIKAVILSKHHYWGFATEDSLSKYDLALGWGPMSNAAVINALDITQGGRWYYYSWHDGPPIEPADIISHSSNHHIIAADQNVLEAVAHFKTHDVVELEGYLVNVRSNKMNWWWQTSVSRFDSGDGACKLFWVTNAFADP